MSPQVEPVEQVVDDDLLYRRLASLHVKPDGTVNSAAFKIGGHPDPHISVDLARLTTPRETLARAPRPGFGLGTLLARDLRSLGLMVRHDPLHDNAAHAPVEGQLPDDRYTPRRLAELTRVLITPLPQAPG